MRVLALCAALTLGAAALPVAALAQDDQTLADIRQELSMLHVEVQRLRRELSTTGGPSVNVQGTTVLERVAAIESELQRLTSQTEQLQHRIDRIVEDGTNRIGDLEFRLVELEGGDVSQLGETTTLGGVEPAAAPAPAPAGPTAEGTQLAVGEQTDFEAAQAALAEGRHQEAAEAFRAFVQTYPGSPLAAEAELGRGRALAEMGDMREAARAYLASFSAAPSGPVAPEALLALGRALGGLGQTGEACVMLGEIPTRFPDAVGIIDAARSEMAALTCG